MFTLAVRFLLEIGYQLFVFLTELVLTLVYNCSCRQKEVKKHLDKSLLLSVAQLVKVFVSFMQMGVTTCICLKIPKYCRDSVIPDGKRKH